MSKITVEAIERRGYTKGLPCQHAVIGIYDAAETTTMPRRLLRELLAADGHARTTVDRTLATMVKRGNLAIRPDRHLELARRELPWTRIVHDPRTKAPNRFGQTALRANASYVRQYLANRLDQAEGYGVDCGRRVICCWPDRRC